MLARPRKNLNADEAWITKQGKVEHGARDARLDDNEGSQPADGADEQRKNDGAGPAICRRLDNGEGEEGQRPGEGDDAPVHGQEAFHIVFGAFRLMWNRWKDPKTLVCRVRNASNGAV